MEKSLKIIYYVVTAHNRWGRGFTEKEALKSAGMPTLAGQRKCEHHILRLILKSETTKEEREQIAPCFVINDFGAVIKATDCTPEDQILIDKCMVGWVETEVRRPKQRKPKPITR